MHKAIIALVMAGFAVGALGCAGPRSGGASTPEEQAVMAPVHQYVEAFNAGDTAKALALCTDPMSIIDEFPPYDWHGAGAGAKWLSDYDADAKRKGITDGVVTLHPPNHIEITGDRAYVVAPANYEYKVHGKPTKQTGSMFTFALLKGASGWRVTAWSWSAN